MSRKTIKILRPERQTELISAAFFTKHFAKNLYPDVEVHSAPLISWTDALLGKPQKRNLKPLKQAASNFKTLTAGYDFLCPSYEGLTIIPLLTYLRNLSKSSIRILFLAHSPGCYSIEWILLKPLLRAGDVIAAPGISAKETIEFLCPELARFIKILPHPIHQLSAKDRQKNNLIVSLSRIDPGKLIHRQIEAMATYGMAYRLLGDTPVLRKIKGSFLKKISL
ncbi:hypothetical protein MCHI_001469 [Candidatus Magnetoovum chiemensis]|nr:hypothetical protein MCHI_001469 [Candidatus Magnetoovum chiemensis]